MKKNTIALWAMLLFIGACNAPEKAPLPQAAADAVITKANWIIGKWKNSSPQGVATEIWEKQNDSTFAGKSYFVAGKDTVSSETLVLKQTGNTLQYIPQVKNQNDGKAIVFNMTTANDSLLVFENPAHDFPQKISYTKITRDSLVAEISGNNKGKPEAQQFPMKREE
jgi:sarcosine oxidase delta subunit